MLIFRHFPRSHVRHQRAHCSLLHRCSDILRLRLRLRLRLCLCHASATSPWTFSRFHGNIHMAEKRGQRLWKRTHTPKCSLCGQLRHVMLQHCSRTVRFERFQPPPTIHLFHCLCVLDGSLVCTQRGEFQHQVLGLFSLLFGSPAAGTQFHMLTLSSGLHDGRTQTDPLRRVHAIWSF